MSRQDARDAKQDERGTIYRRGRSEGTEGAETLRMGELNASEEADPIPSALRPFSLRFLASLAATSSPV